jgi:H2-forming N5,N10-methylenetetrahydromethanopterin dehydrogenase-like enzyme
MFNKLFRKKWEIFRLETKVKALTDQIEKDKKTHGKELASLIQTNKELLDLNRKLDQKLVTRDGKIKELLQSVQHLNNDLNLWEELSDEIAAYPLKTETTLIPKKGVEIFKSLKTKSNGIKKRNSN